MVERVKPLRTFLSARIPMTQFWVRVLLFVSLRPAPDHLDQKELDPKPVHTRAHAHSGSGTGGGSARVWAWFPSNACENFRYPKGTPLVPIFSYLNLWTFHVISKWDNEILHLLVPFIYWIRSTSHLNISFIQKRNWTCEYTTFISNRRRTHSNHNPAFLGTDYV